MPLSFTNAASVTPSRLRPCASIASRTLPTLTAVLLSASAWKSGHVPSGPSAPRPPPSASLRDLEAASSSLPHTARSRTASRTGGWRCARCSAVALDGT